MKHKHGSSHQASQSTVIQNLSQDRRSAIDREILAAQRPDLQLFHEYCEPFGIKQGSFYRYAVSVRSSAGLGERPKPDAVLNQALKLDGAQRVWLAHEVLAAVFADAVTGVVREKIAELLAAAGVGHCRPEQPVKGRN